MPFFDKDSNGQERIDVILHIPAHKQKCNQSVIAFPLTSLIINIKSRPKNF